MYSNNILTFQESTTILNVHTKKGWKLIVCTLYMVTISLYTVMRVMTGKVIWFTQNGYLCRYTTLILRYFNFLILLWFIYYFLMFLFISLLTEFSHQHQFVIFHWSVNDRKSHHISCTLLWVIWANLSDTVVCMVLILPLIFSISSLSFPSSWGLFLVCYILLVSLSPPSSMSPPALRQDPSICFPFHLLSPLLKM